ncbi:MAG: 4-(cytidine 5'-diphospho)-2-C-methyl-D-erythritol kinase [Tannerella sp.]|jgi:4-diphosphocytidyl-2-C-methyl-D-erythritol kinase|nr:4-(cytidine 5'-diphospho)-2-C-methyl-D-erythritol kinase [Tannerella sp.]
MICFPNAKINLGLQIKSKRSDGYHNIESVFYPVPLCDAVEIVSGKKTSFTQTGFQLDSAPTDNLVMKSHSLLSGKYNVPQLDIYLKKAIPSGAGLGGGSSDAAFMMRLLNDFCKLEISDAKLKKMVASVGADCPFFIHNTPAIVSGTGNIFEPSDVSLKGYFLCIAKPPVSVSTKEAYSMVKPHKSDFSLSGLASIPVDKWKDVLYNDFEPCIFEKYPVIEECKNKMYSLGAEYAAMTGSGSAVFGLFKKTVSPTFPDCFVWTGMLK